jgi:Arm DNA-binding domain
MAKHAITREFIRSIKATGKYQDYRDADLAGFALKVTPKGGIAYTYRCTKPDGKQGRKVIGHWPVMQPGDARESARKEAALIDHKGDTVIVQAERKKKLVAVQSVIGVPTLRAFLKEKYRVYLETHIKTPARQIQMIEQAFPALLDKTLDSVTGWELEL